MLFNVQDYLLTSDEVESRAYGSLLKDLFEHYDREKDCIFAIDPKLQEILNNSSTPAKVASEAAQM